MNRTARPFFIRHISLDAVAIILVTTILMNAPRIIAFVCAPVHIPV
jgi:hypothetical protein